jgi:phosphoribosylformylglycinamidine synthase PurS subunit
MRFRAEINVMPHKALLDPQGKAVSNSMKNIGLPEIDSVRIGKHIHLELDADSRDEAGKKVEDACKKLLVNQITETFEFELFEN